MKKKRVATVTWHYYSNFGSALQAYALQHRLRAMGCAPVLLDYRSRKYGDISAMRERVQYMLCKLFPRRFAYPFICFRKEHLTLSRLEQNEKKLPSLLHGVDAVVCGSDQIWAPSVLNSVYLLDFVPDDIPKISYAASVGLDDIPDEMTDMYRHALARFDRLSVREQSASQLLFDKCGVTAKTVIDPTLLLNVAEWESLESDPLPYDNFVFCYFLNKNHTYRKAVEDYASRHSLRVIGCSANPADASWMTMPNPKAGPREFLWLVHHASCVFTDSYHATIFSLLYHKDFVTFERFLATDVLCQNSRIYQLASYFGIDERIVRVTDDTKLAVSDYDYKTFEQALAPLRQAANEYLSEALEIKKG